MKLKKQVTPKYVNFAALFWVGLFVFIGVGFFNANTSFQMAAASANTPYGIQGQMAPELNLSDWIDGNGHQAESIKLSDYRGRVVYLYFFQDW